jgi:CheY-like chemotaxis protein
MNCPRCKSPITESIDADSIITCSGCGARLMTRAAALKSQGKGKGSAAPPATPAPTRLTPESDEEPEGEQTKPPPVSSSGEGPAGSKPAESGRKTRPAEEEASSGSRKGKTPAPAVSASSEAPKEPNPSKAADLPPSATLPPTPAMRLGTRADGDEPGAPIAGPALLDVLLKELQHLRANQEKMLELLGQRPVDRAGASPKGEPPEETVLQPVRSRRRKSVLLVDDDPKTRKAAVAELEQADIPVRAVDDGNEALRLIAEEKPDVIALELALGGEMAGKDLINMLKATMDWVDIPIILWTREPVSTQKEARITHGADELVQKKSGTAALATRVINVFRRA